MRPSLDYQLADASHLADSQAITRLMAAKADEKYRSRHNMTLLHHLMRSKAQPEQVMQCLKLLLTAGAPAKEIWWETGETALILLCKRESGVYTAEMADLLLMAASGIKNNLDHKNESALSYVCSRAGAGLWTQYESRVARVLLSYEANPNIGARLPLIMAAREKNSRLTSMLLRAGADPTQSDTYGQTALKFILRNEWRETIKSVKAKYPQAGL